MNLPKRLKELRTDRKLSQEGLARRVEGLTKQMVSKYENGRSQPPICMLIKLSTFFRVPIDHLVK